MRLLVQVVSALFGVVMRKCEIDGCTNNHRAKGLCIVHYNHLVRYGESHGKFETKFRNAERDYIIGLIERQICFDAQADADGRCAHHGGKCYDLRQLIKDMKLGKL